MTSQPAPGERYQSFSQFYPFYIHEHSNRTCRRIHIVGSALVRAAYFVERGPGAQWVGARQTGLAAPGHDDAGLG